MKKPQISSICGLKRRRFNQSLGFGCIDIDVGKAIFGIPRDFNAKALALGGVIVIVNGKAAILKGFQIAIVEIGIFNGRIQITVYQSVETFGNGDVIPLAFC